ncbi:DUF3173 family protein [Lactococcus sp. S47]|uniref:DUF3173 family protein n=1 Tax=Lactococcus sp. S47 TaxID=2767460 RepID=UPI00190608CC|nr:DUF3173 family protein [Lactococcus sp. S47]MBK0028820.1 DUF3173 family protein [Lactococcus sp. S47]
MKQTVSYKSLVVLGFSKTGARDIIRQAKKIAVHKFEEARNSQNNLVQLTKSPFDNRRLGIAPTEIVEELIGFSLSGVLESEKEDG